MEILERLRSWIISACQRGDSVPPDGIVFWINGLGGTGKTTIAYSIAKWCKTQRLLGGSFFCSRFTDECSEPNLIFLTLCRQLCHHHAPFKDKVEAALSRDPDIVNSGPSRQFEELIVRPLEELDSPFPRSVFVLDALDECKDKGTKSTILSIIAKFVSRIARFLLLIITSRPEQRITALFEASRKDSLKNTTTPLLLHDIPLESVLSDIRLYVDYEFEDRVGIWGINKDWPSIEEKNALVKLSQGLFIYIATAIRFIMDKAHCDPKGQLRSLLTTAPNSSTPHAFLFSLYSDIMTASYDAASPELMSRLRAVVATVALAQEPLSTFTIARLLGYEDDSVRNTLSGMHSVLHVPIDSHQPIRIIHPTFTEFLLQPPPAPFTLISSGRPAPITSVLRILPAEQHWYLFSRCLVAMSALKRDMIGIGNLTRFKSEVEALESKIVASIESHVAYACRYWGVHLRDGVNGMGAADISDPFRNFLRKSLLYWLETCSLLNALDKAVFTLKLVRNVCQVSVVYLNFRLYGLTLVQ